MKFLYSMLLACALLCPATSVAQEPPSATEQKVAKMKEALAQSSGTDSESLDGSKSSLTAELANYKETKEGELSSGSKMLQGLALCVGFFLVGVYFYRRFLPKSLSGSSTSAGQLKVLERIPLTQGTSLVLVEVEGRRTLISVGGEQVQVLEQLQKTSDSSSQIRSSDETQASGKETCSNDIRLSA